MVTTYSWNSHKKYKSGRPSKSFEELSESSKRRKTQKLREKSKPTELIYATQVKLRESGNVEGSKVVKDVTKSPLRAAKYRKEFSSHSNLKEKSHLTPIRALSTNISQKQKHPTLEKSYTIFAEIL